MDRPLVSVVIPTWNRRALLREAIESVRAQTRADWELVIVDDGSTDGTVAMVHALGDPRVKLVECEHSGRKSRLRNLGIAASSGEFVGFLDSDDVWLPNKLEVQLDALRRDGADWCYGDYAHMDEHGTPVPMRGGFFPPADGQMVFRALGGDILKSLLKEETAAYIGTIIARRTLIDQVGGFDEAFNMIEDLDLGFRLAAAAKASATPQCVARVREHSGRILRTYADVREEAAVIYGGVANRATDPELRAMAQDMQAQLWVGVALRCLGRVQILKAASCLLKARQAGASMSAVALRLARAAGRRLGPQVAFD